MVKYWLSWVPEKRYDEAIRVIIDIAESKKDAVPWTPDILHNDIRRTWLCRNKKGEPEKAQMVKKLVSKTS